jgi:acyl dehydratase
LSSSWEYELCREKLREFRSALAITESGEVPPGFVFAYAVVPALYRALPHPELKDHRARLRLASIDVSWNQPIAPGDRLSGTLGTIDRSGVSAICTVEAGFEPAVEVRLGFIDAPDVSVEPGPVLGERITADAGRSVAFAAATWDLNPAYYNERFASASGLDVTIVPPGLPVSWVLQMIRRSSGSRLTHAQIGFGPAARTGAELMGRVAQSSASASFSVTADDTAVCWGKAAWNHESL